VTVVDLPRRRYAVSAYAAAAHYALTLFSQITPRGSVRSSGLYGGVCRCIGKFVDLGGYL